MLPTFGGFNLIEASNVDRAIADDMTTDFGFIARHSGAVYPNDYEAEIKAITRQWRPEVWKRSQETV